MEDRLRQLLIIGGVFQPFLLLFEYLEYEGSLWAVSILYNVYLIVSFFLFLFPMYSFNKIFMHKHPLLYTFFIYIGWVPCLSIPLNIGIATFKNGIPLEYFNYVVTYISLYEIALSLSFLLAFCMVIRRAYIDYREKNAKKRRY